MKVHYLKRKQFLPITVTEAWRFFSSPGNLAMITPGEMGVEVVHMSGKDKMYAGQIIHYKLQLLPFITTDWITEITHIQEPYFFVDEQRLGPYALWHHEHLFKNVANGVEVTDEINYAIPFGFIGRIAHDLFVERQLKTIFDFRFHALERHFLKEETEVHKTESPWISTRS